MRLSRIDFSEIPGWKPEEALAAWPAFRASCEAIAGSAPQLRTGAPTSRSLIDISERAPTGQLDSGSAERFFIENFQPFRVRPVKEPEPGFVTGYYEPLIEASTDPTQDFTAPILPRPHDLIDLRGAQPAGWDRTIEGGRKIGGVLEPYPDRAEIEGGAIDDRVRPILWLRDHVEVFFVQVQGSARVILPDGRQMRLVYAGRNGRPYSSIGRALIEAGHIPADEMSLERCKAWLRANGLGFGDAGRAVLQGNASYVFFRLEEIGDPTQGPIGGQGLPLAPLRSIAVDRNIWPYGTPFWLSAELGKVGLDGFLPGRLMIAQDTGSAILGPARADLFIGTGDAAGAIAGKIRHPAEFIVLLPRES